MITKDNTLDEQIDKIIMRARINNNSPRQVYVDNIKSIIESVCFEAIKVGVRDDKPFKSLTKYAKRKIFIKYELMVEQTKTLQTILNKGE